MRTLLPDPPPQPFEDLLEWRRRIGADRHDEVWEGVLHMSPGPHEIHSDVQCQIGVLLYEPARAAGLHPRGEFNIGERDNYRVPDGGLRRERVWRLYAPSAALVVEVVSPNDETWDKLGFYAAHDVRELVIADPQTQTVHWLTLEHGEYRPIERSGVIELGPAELAQRIDWPPTDA
jgi:Uma2 family endonuclease